MSFKIKITETREVVKRVGKDWAQVGTKEVSRAIAFINTNEDETSRMEPVYDYTPEIEKTIEEERDVLIQEVDTLDVAAVIRAVNGLENP